MEAAPFHAIRDFLPRGNRLDDDAFARRHQTARWVLGLHVPVLFAAGLAWGNDPGWTAAALLLPTLCLVLCTSKVSRRLAASLTTVGLVSGSFILVQLSQGAPASYLHLLAMLGFVGLYQDWIPLLLAVVTGVAVSGLGVPVLPDVVPDGERSLEWAGATGGAALLLCLAQILLWRASEEDQRKNARLAADLARAQTQIEARESVSELFVNLARRNQVLLDRQIAQIVAMEERTSDPDSLGELFRLDHLATRIRRNAESLLVLSGEEPARRWGLPVPLADVVRAAIAEVEDFRRCDAVIDGQVAVNGRAVADIAHLLAELIENGLQFSPPESRVRVTNHDHADGGCTIVVEDRGIGLSDVDQLSANDLLVKPPEVDLRLSKRLGFHVVSRLAARYGLRVVLSDTPGGGATVTVKVPAELLATVDGTGAGAAPAPDVASSPDVPAAAPLPLPTPPAPRPLQPRPTVAGRPIAPLAPAPMAPAARNDSVRSVPTVAGRPIAAASSPLPPPAPARTGTLAPAAAVRPLVAPTRPVAPTPPAPPRPLPTDGAGTVAGQSVIDPAALPVARRTAEAVSAPLLDGPLAAPPPPPAPVPAPAAALPRRVPQSSLNPQMREPQPEGRVAVADARSREEVRAMLSRFQAGQAKGRSEAAESRTALFGEEAR